MTALMRRNNQILREKAIQKMRGHSFDIFLLFVRWTLQVGGLGCWKDATAE